MNILKLTSLLNKSARRGKAGARDQRLSAADLGILKVAFMIAALDGDVSDDEYRTFTLMAKKCAGGGETSANAALEAAMRSAGYLMMLAGHTTENQLKKAFIDEAKVALPNGFAYLPIEDIRKAMTIWVMMAMSDGDYSHRERLCIEALRKTFAEMKASKIAKEEDRWLALSPAYRQAIAPGSKGDAVAKLVSKDFISRAEQFAASYGNDDDAARELAALING